ncbi:class I SAM-dependent methyltransferase [Streptomyces mesophilus]|uniref:class I SAM-dependent methyltransferase n=1 Tax=Streptomyces mesophilus TaxID=1775132 RepID=UPI00332156D0
MSEPGFLTATRDSYDTISDAYAEWAADELAVKPVERSVLACFAELAAGQGPMADVGCGTGRVTAHLTGLGADVFGIDLSPGMLAAARKRHPELRFVEGSMTALDLPDESLGSALAWYSVIHVPDAQLPDVFAEFHRVLKPGGHFLLGFQIGEEPARLTEALGHTFDLTFHRRTPEAVAELLRDAGFEERMRVVKQREDEGPFPEKTPQGFLIFRKALADR